MTNIFYLPFSLYIVAMMMLIPSSIFAKHRIKDLVTVKGVRDNPLVGYGLVIGLNGTGDSGGEVTNVSLTKMFKKLGLDPKTELSSQNVAAVVITANLPPFGRIGQKADVLVSSIGDASSLAGGTLLVTPLKGGDGNIYAIAQGPLSIGGMTQGQNYPTTATIINGATIEKEIDINFLQKQALRLALKTPDFTTAVRVEKTINNELGGKFAKAKDATTIDILIPPNYSARSIELMALVENFKIFTDHSAKITINERTGTVIASGDIAIKATAIGHGDLSIEIGGDEDDEGPKGPPQRFLPISESSSLQALVKALNALGTSPEDLISIFQTLKKNGALIGDIEFI